MKAIKFNKSHSPYTEGDIAGVDEAFAKFLIEKGIAVEFVSESAPITLDTKSGPLDRMVKSADQTDDKSEDKKDSAK